MLIETARLVDGYEDHESKRRQIVDEFEAPAAIRRSADRYPTGYQTAIKHLSDKTLTSLFQAVKYNEVLRSTALDQLKHYIKDKRNKAIWIQRSKLDQRSYPFLQDKPTITRQINGNLTVQDVVDRVPMAQLQGGVVVEYNIMRLAIEQSIDDQQTKDYYQFLRDNINRADVKAGVSALLPKYAELKKVAGENCPSLDFLIEISGLMNPSEYDHLKNPTLVPFNDKDIKGEGDLAFKIQSIH